MQTVRVREIKAFSESDQTMRDDERVHESERALEGRVEGAEKDTAYE